MFEILVLGEYQSGVFLSNSFKYELEINHSDRGTLMAKKMLHAFYTEYDLAYAGNLQGRGSSPGIHYDILTSIECKYVYEDRFVIQNLQRYFLKPA